MQEVCKKDHCRVICLNSIDYEYWRRVVSTLIGASKVRNSLASGTKTILQPARMSMPAHFPLVQNIHQNTWH